jgi:flagellin-like hook-associated protein FlgL
MTTIPKSMFPLKTSFTLIAGMKERYDRLQQQLATGERAQTLAEMGSSRAFSISMRARLARIEGYEQTMTAVGLRLDVLNTAMSRLDQIEAEQRTSAYPGGRGSSDINLATLPTTSRARLDEVLAILNSQAGDRYLFAGSRTDRRPVVSAAEVMNGDGARAGFLSIAGERTLADRGADGLGRLSVQRVANSVFLAQDGSHPFGLKLSTLLSSSAPIVLTQPAGSPPALGITFNTADLPVAGAAVTLGFTLPDGSKEAITLTAVTGTPGAGEFSVGPDGDSSALSFAAALEASIGRLVAGKGAAASLYAAAEDFFNAQGEGVMRVAGPPVTATTLVAASSADTVLWYAGEDSSDPRATVNAKIDDRTSVSYGMQANESGIVALVRSLAAMAAASFPEADPTAGERYDAMASRQMDRLAESRNNEAGSLEAIAVELGVAAMAIRSAGERQTVYEGQLETMLAELETVPPEQVSMEILALRTRLEASYQATSLIAQLSLVHYLP